MAEDCNCCHEQSLPGLQCCFWKLFFGGKLQRHLCLPGIPLNPFTLEKGGALEWISLQCFQSDVAMHTSSRLLSTVPKWGGLLYQTEAYCICILNSLKFFEKKEVIAINIIVIRTTKAGVIVQSVSLAVVCG